MLDAPKVCRIGGGLYEAISTIDIRAPLGYTFYMQLTVDVVKLNISLFLGPDTMDEYRMFVHTVTNLLLGVSEGVDLPVLRKLGFVFYDWGSLTFYFLAELQCIHKHFFHANPERLYALMRRANDKDAVPATPKNLQDLTDACDVCQLHAKAPRRFIVGMSKEDIRFNQLIYADLMWLEGKTALHTVDNDTETGAAALLDDG